MQKIVEDKNIEELTKQLESGLAALMSSDSYKEYLRTMSKFTNYSVNNSILIAMQRPDATYVAGYKSWQANFGRHVNKGEKGIKILAPSPYKVAKMQDKIDQDGHIIKSTDGTPIKERVEVIVPAFKVINVWDISQTSGKDLPDIVHRLGGSVDGYQDLIRAVESYSSAPITYADVSGSANGFYRPSDHTIVIQKGLSEQQTLKTALHELTHATLHQKDYDKAIAPDRHTQEVQAESVAYTVCQYYGIDSSDYSFGYIAGWSSDIGLKEFHDSLETIRTTARAIINGLNKELDAIQLAREPKQVEPMKDREIDLDGVIHSGHGMI